MKIFSIKSVIGLAAIGGVAAYVRKQGGFRNAFDKLLAKKDELLAKKDELLAKPLSNQAEPVG